MIRWREGRVLAIGREWSGACEIEVAITLRSQDVGFDEEPDPATGVVTRTARALAYPHLVGRPHIDDRVLLNTNALALGLGTGGYAMVVAIPDRLPEDAPPAPGHLMKARYTPLQAVVMGVDEQESPHHELLRDADDLDQMPVVVADLHSALAAIIAGARSVREPIRPIRIVSVVTDGGALPAWFSRTTAGLSDAGWLSATVTVGQAFGGTLEAVTLHSGLLAARHILKADIAVVAQGPGNLGTGTKWGFSGVSVGEAVNAIATLNGRPVGSLRISDADPRERHRGLSHHCLTAYGRVALAPADLAMPALDSPLADAVRADLATLSTRHNIVEVDVAGLAEALDDVPVALSTMGRGLYGDLGYFLAAAAAGKHAASLLSGGGT